MIKNIQLLMLGIITAILLSCDAQNEATSEGSVLNIDEYLKVADEGIIYPTQAQLEMLKGVMPKETFQLAPPVSNRKYWEGISKIESAQNYFNDAVADLEKAPEIPISDATYYRANLEGNRRIYKPRYYNTMERLEKFIIAECIENRGRFLQQVEVYCDSIMAMKSWLHPNHDRDNDVIERRRVSIDLGARKFGVVLALADALLEDKLPTELRTKIADQLQWRIMDSYLASCKLADDKSNHWIRSTSNWNSVCTSGTVLTTIISSNNYDERIAVVGSALNSMVFYLSGFGQDGYCSEGTGYWRYGFGHYFYLAEILYNYTDGKINLFDFNNPGKLKNVANFPENFQIHEGMYAPFSDGVSKVKQSEDNFAYLMAAKYYGAQKPTSFVTNDAVQNLIFWSGLDKYLSDTKTKTQLPGHTYFDDFGIVISRGQQDIPFSIAIKAGHNAENHNHMDVGSYVLVLGEDYPAGDIGAPSYIAGAFDDDNPARNSWGHPVPIIDNTFQSKGREFSGKITQTEFSDKLDRVVMDIKAAYEIPALNSLVRVMENDKSGQGAISITDKFLLSKPVDFGVAVMTLSDYEIVDGNTVMLKTEHQTLKAEVFSDDGTLVIKDELVPVEHLREGAPAYRIGVDFTRPISEGSLTVKYTPVF